MSLIEHLASKGLDIHVIAPKDEYSEKIIQQGYVLHPWHLQQKGTNLLSELKSIVHLAFLFIKIKPSYALNFTIKANLYSTLISKVLGIRSVNNVSGLGTVFLREGLFSKLAKKLYSIIFRHSYHVFFQNAHDEQLFVNQHWVRPNKHAVLPGSGVNLKKISPITFTQKQTLNFVMVARLLFDKGIIEYLESAKYINQKYPNEANFHLFGKIESSKQWGIKENDLQPYIENRDIQYHGFYENLHDFLQEMDVMVLPSYREGMSKVLLESLAMGMPIITCDVPGCQETVLEGENGFLCEAKSVESLQKTFEKMLQLTFEERVRFGNQSRALAEKYFDEIIVFKAYEKVMSG